MRYLSIDYGTKRIGLAVCDRTETVVSPLTTLPADGRLAGKIAEIVKSEEIGAIVLGLPLNMDGSEGPQAKRSRGFAEALKRQAGLPVYFQDERLSSFAAEEKMVDIEPSWRKRQGRVDAVAAAEILQAFLDSRPPAGKKD
jgi:putative Holliday junction resolvase